MPRSAKLLVQLAKKDIAIFRYLLEAHENLALATTLERKTALLKVIYFQQSERDVIAALEDIRRAIPLNWQKWPEDFG